MRIALAVILSALAALVAGHAQAPASPLRATVTASGIFVVRPDPRECPSPLCGGYWVSLANHARTRCSDGLLRPRCYVSSAVDADKRQPVSIQAGALAKGVLEVQQSDDWGQLGVLTVGSSWAPVGQASATGTFFRLRDTGIRCVRAACLSIRARVLNSAAKPTLVSSLDLGPARSGTARRHAEAALASSDGLLAAGSILAAADRGRVLHASQVYLKNV